MAVFDPSRAAAGFAQMAEDFERKAERYQRLQTRMTALTATDSGAGGRVTVTVDANGIPTAITLGSNTRGMDPATVSAEIMSGLRRAQAKLRADITEVVRDTVGEDPAGASIVEGFARRFPDPEPAPDAPNSGSAAPVYTPPAPAYVPRPDRSAVAEPSAPQQNRRKPDRDRIVTPDEPDPDDEYYNRKSWLV